MKIAFLDAKTREVLNKIPDAIGLFKKTDHDAKISDITKKCFYYVWLWKSYTHIKEKCDAKIKEKWLFNNSNILKNF